MGHSNQPDRPTARTARLAATSDDTRSIGEKRLRLALEAAGLGAWEVDALQDRATWSLRAREILGLPALGAISTEQLAAVVHPDDQPRFTAFWGRAGAAPGNHACEFRVLPPDGAVRWVLLRGRTAPGGNGKHGSARSPGLRVGTVLDVTPRKTAEEALRSSRSLLAEAQRIAHLGAFEWELPSRRAVWTDEVFRIVGIEPGSVQPTVETMLDHVHPDDRGELTRLVERCIQTGEPFSWKFRVVRPDGSGRVALRQGHMVYGPTGVPLRIVGTVQDVTEEAHEEAQRHERNTRDLRAQRLESLAVLSGGIAPRGAGALLLVVDDEEAVLTVTRRMLERHGFRVLTAIDGAAGLRVFQEHRGEIRAVLLDLTMPVMGGEEALREIRRIDPQTPVLLASGYSEQDATARFGELGLTGFVAKPFDSERLAAALEAVIHGPRPEEAAGAVPAPTRAPSPRAPPTA